MVELNRQHYPCEDDRSLFEDTSLYLSTGNSMDAAVVEKVDEMARAAGWPKEPWATRGDRPGHWSKATLGAAMAIAKQAWTWADYIAERSGRKLQLSWGLYEQFASLFQ